MATNLAQLRAALIDKLGLLEIDEMIPTASLNRSINIGINRMATEMDWPWLEDTASIATTAGNYEYDLPDDVTRVRVASIGGLELDASTLREMVRFFGEDGEPELFAITGNKIRLAPAPAINGTMIVVYTRTDNTLSADGDTVITPDAYVDVIVTYAAIDQAIRLKDASLLASLRAAAIDWQNAIHDNVIRSTKAPRIQTRDDF